MPPVFGIKARTEDTEGRLSLLEVILARDIPRHVHHVADECIYVLDGVLEVEFDDRVEHVTAGGFVLLPHGVPHARRRGRTGRDDHRRSVQPKEAQHHRRQAQITYEEHQ